MTVIPCLGNISCLIQTAPYQYSPPRSGLGSPAFLNGSNQSGGSLAPSNNGAYGLRFLWSNLSPFDDSGNLVQYAGGSISPYGVCNVGHYLSDLEQYHPLSSANNGEYLLADTANGSVLFDAANSQAGGSWPVSELYWPADLKSDLVVSLPTPVINSGLQTGWTLNWAGHVNVFDIASNKFETYTRHPQAFGGNGYSFYLYWQTQPNTYQGLPAQYEAETFYGLSKQVLGVFNLSGGLGAVGWSMQNSNGTGFWWDETEGVLKTVLRTSYPVVQGSNWTALSNTTAAEFSVSSDNNAAQINGNIVGAILPGGNYLLSPQTISPRYLLVLADLSGYYGINFHGVDNASQNALAQDGGYSVGFGQDLQGNFWFQSGGILFSSLGLDSFKIFNSGNYSPLPFINFQSLDCRRLIPSLNIAWEG